MSSAIKGLLRIPLGRHSSDSKNQAMSSEICA